jgi:hypothetical protein
MIIKKRIICLFLNLMEDGGSSVDVHGPTQGGAHEH